MERITSRRNPICVHIKRLGTDREYRETCGEFVCDGIKLLEEADKWGAQIITVLTSAHIPFPLSVDTKVYLTDNSLINSISPLKHAQTVVFTCKIPKKKIDINKSGTKVLLDGLQDPGNVGTILRTANAFNISQVYLTGSCADIYNPKTIRATMGAIFRQDASYISINELSELKANGAEIIGAALGEDSEVLGKTPLKDKIIAIGSEGKGLSSDVLKLCDKKVIIPISDDCESLNAAVAAAVLMWSATG